MEDLVKLNKQFQKFDLETLFQVNIQKALKRDRKINQRRSGMRITNRSIFILEEEKKKRAEEIKKERELKEAEKLKAVIESKI